MWSWFQRKTPVRVPPAAAAPPGFWFQIKASVVSDRGIREANEDAVCVLTHPDPRLRSVRMVGLADGMGGHAAGEVASRTCLQTCSARLQTVGECDVGAQMLEALHGANRAVWDAAQVQPEFCGMGTTVCLLAFDGDHCRFGWVGDSRIYRLRDGELQLLTHDDTVVNALLAQGVLSPEEALHHPERHVLSQALGTSPELLNPHLSEPQALRHGDIFLLSSDGVHDVLEHAQIAQLLGSDIHASGLRLVEQSMLAGSQDNLSAVVVHVQRTAVSALDKRPTGRATTVETQPCA